MLFKAAKHAGLSSNNSPASRRSDVEAEPDSSPNLFFPGGVREGRGRTMRKGEAEQEVSNAFSLREGRMLNRPRVSRASPGMPCRRPAQSMLETGRDRRCLCIPPLRQSSPKRQPLALPVSSCPCTHQLRFPRRQCPRYGPELPRKASSGQALPSAPTFPGHAHESTAF